MSDTPVTCLWVCTTWPVCVQLHWFRCPYRWVRHIKLWKSPCVVWNDHEWYVHCFPARVSEYPWVRYVRYMIYPQAPWFSTSDRDICNISLNMQYKWVMYIIIPEWYAQYQWVIYKIIPCVSVSEWYIYIYNKPGWYMKSPGAKSHERRSKT